MTPSSSARPGPTPSESATPASTDGRTARADRTRAAIVEALLQLLDEGDLQPTASRIAERAGISLRLIYHHFGDLESLFRAAAAIEGERLAAMAEPIDPALALDERIEALVAQRATMLEWISPVRRAALLQEPFSEELRAARDAFHEAGIAQVQQLFAAELAARPAPDRDAVLHALAVPLLWGTWNDLRTTGCSVEQATAALRALVRALLGA